MHSKTRSWLVYAGIAIALAVGGIAFRNSTQATTEGCPRAGTKACAEAKATQFAIRHANDVQTAEALPPFTPVLEAPTPIGGATSEPALKPLVIRQLTNEERVESSLLIRHATTAWLTGYVPSSNPDERDRVFVVSYPASDGFFSSIRYDIQAIGVQKADLEKYTRVWFAPKDIGEIQITDVTGIDGIVSFKTSTGIVGRFDLAKQTWSFQ